MIAHSHLTTFTVNTTDGQNLTALADELKKPIRGVDMVAPFGTSLHVSGRDEAALRSGDCALPRPAGLGLGTRLRRRSKTCSSI